MADQQNYGLSNIVGDGKAEVIVAVDAAEKDYGQGGGVVVSVKLTCNQSDEHVAYAIAAAAAIAKKHLVEQFDSYKQTLRSMGLVR